MISAMEVMHRRFSLRIGWGVRLGMADAWDVQGRTMDMTVYNVVIHRQGKAQDGGLALKLLHRSQLQPAFRR